MIYLQMWTTGCNCKQRFICDKCSTNINVAQGNSSQHLQPHYHPQRINDTKDDESINEERQVRELEKGQEVKSKVTALQTKDSNKKRG